MRATVIAAPWHKGDGGCLAEPLVKLQSWIKYGLDGTESVRGLYAGSWILKASTFPYPSAQSTAETIWRAR
eukprot:CAMPEP_0182918114 /NCGR_PEP_ID=MMETSP0105_2-20130417/1895_1 /TAXON_ID=81532 ORGANISM="Acanthoeca-like sp., Strain 10tr" /NCGR_SAMPLE_ID=MMETSP0105_2 /ASSEMBLY_ACC=CAM_ASM_000205 /LENGTH=70 /DNA_ID=CAMNT_0025055159 /DNA_START=77 /DNA_END=286 /DNA_ORIENTATION=+